MQYNAAAYLVKGEDECICAERSGVLLLGVADGHGGRAAARMCKERLITWFEGRTAEQEEDGMRSRFIVDELQAVFVRLHDEARRLPCCSGAALTVCIVDRATGEFTCANVGDAGCLLVSPTSHMWMTTTHRLQDNAQERSRLKEHISCIVNRSGGMGEGPPRLFPGGLACSRAIGDGDCPHVCCTPSVTSGVVGPHDTLVIASDGLWDHASSVRRVARTVRESRCAQTLLRRSCRSYDDDASVIVAAWAPRKVPSTEGIRSLFMRSSSGSSFSSDDEPPTRTVFSVSVP